MKNVTSLKNGGDVSRLCAGLNEAHPKYRLLFLIGVETGLRVSDILNLRVKDFKTSVLTVQEKKTKKNRTMILSDGLKGEVKSHAVVYALTPSNFVVFSRMTRLDKPLSRIQVYKVFKRVAGELGMTCVGTHSMRKTFAINHYRKNHDIVALQKELNHKFVATTLCYLFDSKSLNSFDI